MPHIIIKLWTGKPEDKKRQLAEEIKKMTMDILGTPDTSISVAFEETTPEDWPEKVYGPDIMAKEETLYIKPGYVPDIFKK